MLEKPCHVRLLRRKRQDSRIRILEITKDIGVDFALWAKKLCQEAEESFNGLKGESATD